MDVRAAVERQVAAAYAPLVLVQSSDGAEATARRNGLTVVDLLRPFAALAPGTTVPLRTGSRSFALSDFAVRLLPATELSAASIDSIEPHLLRAVSAQVAAVPPATLSAASIASQEDAERLLAGKGLPTNAAAGKDSKDPSPWLATYRRGLHSHLRCLPTEQRDAPLLTLVVVSTSDASPMSAAYELASSSALPRPFAADQFDPDIHRCFLLLADQAPPPPGAPPRPPVDPSGIYRELRQHFQAPVFLLPINSGLPGVGPPPADVWGPAMQEPLFSATLSRAGAGAAGASAASGSAGSGAAGDAAPNAAAAAGPGNSAYARALLAQAAAPARGCCLAPDDVSALRATMNKVLTEGVAKALEARYVGLTGAIAANKRSGLGGMVRSWLRPASGSTRDVLAEQRAAGLAGLGGSASQLTGVVVGGGGPGGTGSPSPPTAGGPSSGSGEGGDGGSDLTSVSLPHGSLESQLRQLGDLCMAMGDYEAAASHYKRLKDELRPERFPGYTAAAAEGAGLATFLASGPSRDVDALLDTAFTLYIRAAAVASAAASGGQLPFGADGAVPVLPPLPPPGAPGSTGIAVVTRRLGVRLASRAACFAADAMVAAAHGALAAAGITTATSPSALAAGGPGAAAAVSFAGSRLRDASSLLRRAAQAEGDGSLASALLTEQAGIVLLRSLPLASLRKAAYHFATAGGLYGSAGVAGLAVRCLSLGLSAYGSDGTGGWTLVEDALVTALAQRLAAVGDAGAACEQLARLLARGGSRLPQNTQRTLLAQLLRSYASWAAAKEAAAVASAAGRKAKAAAKAGGDAALTDGEKRAAAAEGAASAVLGGCGLPTVDDASFAVASFSNGWAAALAVHAASNPGAAVAAAAGTPAAAPPGGGPAPPSNDAQARQLCAGVLERLGLPPSVPLSGPAASAPAALLPALPTAASGGVAALLVEAGVAPESPPASVGVAAGKRGPVLAGGLFAGHLPGEGPAPPRLQALAGSPWSRMQEHQVARELRTREKLRAALAAVQKEQAAPSTAASSQQLPRYDWRAVCHDLAVLLEDEAEQHGRELMMIETSGFGKGGAAPAGSSTLGLLGQDLDGDVDDWAANEAALKADAAGVAAAAAAPAAAAAAAPSKCHPAPALSAPAERYVGEPLAVTVTLRNPLAMELPVIGLTLEHAWLGAGKDEPDAASAATSGRLGLASDALWIAPGAPGASVDDGRGGAVSAGEVVRRGLATLPVDLLLQPGEARTVHLLARPLRPGALVLKGASWSVAGLVRCSHDFALKGPPLNDSRNNKASNARAMDRRLETTVAAPREWLSVRLSGVAGGQPPSASGAVSMHDGERRACGLTVTNHGDAPVGGPLLLRWEGKGRLFAAVHAGAGESGGLAPTKGLDGALTRLDLVDAAEVRDAAGRVVTALPTAPAAGAGGSDEGASPNAAAVEVAVLPPGWTATWRVTVRAAGTGRHTARAMLWYGKPGAPMIAPRSYAPGTAVLRCARLAFRALVRPSVVTTALVEPCVAAAGEYVLTVTATHVAQARGQAQAQSQQLPVSLPLAVTDVTVVSDHWAAALTSHTTYAADGGASATVAVGDAGSDGGATKAWALGRPLAYGETRVLTFRLSRRVPAAGGGDSLAAPQRRAVRPALRVGALTEPQTALLRLARAHAMVAQAIVAGQDKERRARAAAAAQDALPPTLRSIAQERAAAEAAAQRQQEEEELHDEEEQAGIAPPQGAAAAAAAAAAPSGSDGNLAATAAAALALEDGADSPGSAAAAAAARSTTAAAKPAARSATAAAAAATASAVLRSFPASLDALRGGPAKVHVVVSWAQWTTAEAAMSDGTVAGGAFVDATSGSGSGGSDRIVGDVYHHDLPTLTGRYLSLPASAASAGAQSPLSPTAAGAAAGGSGIATDVGVCAYLGPSPALLPVAGDPAAAAAAAAAGQPGSVRPRALSYAHDDDGRAASVAAASCYLASTAADPTGGGGRVVTVYRAPLPHHLLHHLPAAAQAAPVVFLAHAAGSVTPDGGSVLVGADSTPPTALPVTGTLTLRQAFTKGSPAIVDGGVDAAPPLVVVPAPVAAPN